MLLVALPADRGQGATGQIPQRDTTKVGRALPLAHEGLEGARRDVTGPSGVGGGWETDEDLGILVLVRLLQDVDPALVVEAVSCRGRLDGITVGVVVELLMC